MHRPLVATLAASLALAGCYTGDRDLPDIYRDMGVPVDRLASNDVQRQGRAIFRERCVPCHGEQADGKGPLGGALRPPPRDLTDARWRSLTDERHVYYAIAEGRHGTPMPPWKATLSPGEIWSLVAYVRSLNGQPLGAASEPAEGRQGISREGRP